MFNSKKNNLPPRPSLPLPEQILEDLHNANKNDITFNIIKSENEKKSNSYFSSNTNETENIYEKARGYLDGIQQLKVLEKQLNEEQESLKISYDEITKLAQDIRNQAQAVLIK
ncbi:UPF0449 protein C19orf25 homolog [Chelonus insularis]|uniref:UPF0449 protein C19orf25 homolog n=1 Tax=Chelonus insularis TaxID=460826 RepID=UPI00158CCC16|nr:UPF0449 protein C19orf25 homolog [Chelonus insularis]